MKYMSMLLLFILVGCGQKESSKKVSAKTPPKELLTYKTPGVYIVEKDVLSSMKTPGVYITELSSSSSSLISKECKLSYLDQEINLNLKFIEIDEQFKVVLSSDQIEDDIPLIDYLMNLPSFPNEDMQNLSAKIQMNENLLEGELQVALEASYFKIAEITCL
jgi:hypothetical protein